MTLNIGKEESVLSDAIFKRLEAIALVDKYSAYQALDDEWTKTAVDLEILQTEGFDAVKKVDPNMVLKKKNGQDEVVQDGWRGHVIPFELVQSTILKEEAAAVKRQEEQLADIQSSYEEIIDSLSEEEKETTILNDANDAFVPAEVNKRLKEIYKSIETPEIKALYGYLSLTDQKESKLVKMNYVENHPEVSWDRIETNRDGTFGKSKLNAYIKELQTNYCFDEESFEGKLVKVGRLLEEEKVKKSQAKEAAEVLHLLTKETVEGLSDAQAFELLEEKWIVPLMAALQNIPDDIIADLISHIRALTDKYATTYAEVAEQIAETKTSLAALIDELTGNEYDMKGLGEFQSLLKGK